VAQRVALLTKQIRYNPKDLENETRELIASLVFQCALVQSRSDASSGAWQLFLRFHWQQKTSADRIRKHLFWAFLIADKRSDSLVLSRLAGCLSCCI
jgi:hypothetical protein